MNLAIVIPTYKRIKKLERCLNAIEKSLGRADERDLLNKMAVYVYCDNNDLETYEWLIKSNYNCNVTPYLNENRLLAPGCWNKFFSDFNTIEWDACQWLVDDVEVEEGFFIAVIETMQEHFPDYDGVIGTKQICPGREDYTFKWYGQPLIGRKFAERYPNRQVCCPSYKHFFQDEEMYLYASSLDKFEHAKNAVMKHYHPNFVPSEYDDTHFIVRGNIKNYDYSMFEKRQKLNLIWGKSFEQ